jgi:hypothetical protein
VDVTVSTGETEVRVIASKNSSTDGPRGLCNRSPYVVSITTFSACGGVVGLPQLPSAAAKAKGRALYRDGQVLEFLASYSLLFRSSLIAPASD